MRTTRQLSITLPNDMADGLRERVRSGEYASESEVIREGLRALFARDQAVEAWLRDEVAAAYDAVIADPSRGVSAQAVRARLAGDGRASASSSRLRQKTSSLSCTATSRRQDRRKWLRATRNQSWRSARIWVHSRIVAGRVMTSGQVFAQSALSVES